jgi:hypothetical protein
MPVDEPTVKDVPIPLQSPPPAAQNATTLEPAQTVGGTIISPGDGLTAITINAVQPLLSV